MLQIDQTFRVSHRVPHFNAILIKQVAIYKLKYIIYNLKVTILCYSYSSQGDCKQWETVVHRRGNRIQAASTEQEEQQSTECKLLKVTINRLHGRRQMKSVTNGQV